MKLLVHEDHSPVAFEAIILRSLPIFTGFHKSLRYIEVYVNLLKQRWVL